ncbi:MAG: aspartate/glutamate racemase family protein [Atribacterota bacterium]|jgi:allantoin racemase|nr:aspartate/glutamate racemase family protein [Verrucomicrobiota bacterium]MDD2353562.1 aspartate/glutamate racemase family protein [Atribacterota bacterium]MDD4343895.1 aspartate/glutamate racemase family protein [Eubacteriales bacterium]
MKILCINPNSSKEVTEGIKKTCGEYALSDTIIDVKQIDEAPSGIESYQDAAISEKYIIEKFKKWEQEYEGFIIACHSDIGIDLLRELTTKPVIGIGEASILYSLPLGHKFSILSLKRKKIPQKEDLVRKYALEKRCASIRATGLGVVETEKRKREKLLKEGMAAVQEDGAEVLILGCAGMAGLDKEIEKSVKVPVIDGVVCALMMIESLIRYKVGTSKIAKYS